MSTLSSDRKPLVDYGVQIRFIKDLHDTGGGFADKSRGLGGASSPSSRYGVAVHVQGISGQPYVVLKDGDKGDSYGVQLNSPTPGSGPPSPCVGYKGSREAAGPVNPYSPVNAPHSPVSPVDEEVGEIFRNHHRRPPGDGQAGTQGEEEAARKRDASEANGETAGDEQYNEAGLKPVRSKGARQAAPGYTGSLGRRPGKSHAPSQVLPEAPAVAKDEPAPAIDTNSLAPINKLINKFNGAPQERGRTGARQRLRFDERKRSRSLDARKDVPHEVSPPIPLALNPYAAPPTSSSSSSSHWLGSSPASVARVTTPEASKAPGKFVAKDSHPAVARKPEATPRSHIRVNGQEAAAKRDAYRTPKDDERDGAQVRGSSGGPQKGGSDGIIDKDKLEELQEQLRSCKKQLQQVHDELAEERIGREVSESRLRLQEDQLAELQEELRRFSVSQTDAVTLQADLAEAAMLRQRQEEILRQRERELTALKGALKEEVECHDKEMEALREQYSQDMENLRSTMEQVTQSQEQIEEERERVNASMSTLEEELESCRDQRDEMKSQLDAAAQQLDAAREELLKSCLEKDDMENELRDLQDSLKQQTADGGQSAAEELQRCCDEVRRARADLDKLKEELEEKRRALQALRKTSGEKEAELLGEISSLKEQTQRDKAALEKAKESHVGLSDRDSALELQEANSRLRERLARMTRLHSAPRSPVDEDALEALEDENRSLKTQLEEAKRGGARLGKERDELSRRLEERDLEREALRRSKSELEEQKRLLDRALEKISKEMETMMGDSRQAVSTLQTQLDDYRERSRKDLLEAQRSSKERLAELQRAQSSLKAQQDEVSRLKKELLACSEDRDGAQLERDLLNNRLKHLESELESEKSSQTDRSREIRGLEDRIKTMEIELDEERSSGELLNDRVARSRDQVDQLRSELMQERSARHDLEMDKSALERQLKEMRSRVADMEGQTRPAPGISLLENKVQELEERLRSEEREKSSIQASQRRAERKLKELNATLDQERSQHVEQRDQLSLRVKALKRQVDESEGEVERLEGVRRKVLRDLEEQQELQEALHAKVTALEAELKRKSQLSHRAALGSSALSSEDEDGFYDANKLSESLQSCN